MTVPLSIMLPDDLRQHVAKLFVLDLDAVLDHILYEDMAIVQDDLTEEDDTMPAPVLPDLGPQFDFSFQGKVVDNLVLGLPAVAGMELVLGGGRIGLEASVDLDAETSSVTVTADALSLRFARSLLQPVVQRQIVDANDPTGQRMITVYMADPDSAKRVELAFPVSLSVDESGSIDLTWPLDSSQTLVLTPAMISDTGVVVEGELAVDFSTSAALANASGPAADPAWVGVIIRNLKVYLPPDMAGIPPSELTADLVIGSHGFSGLIRGAWVDVAGNPTAVLKMPAVGRMDQPHYEGAGSFSLFGLPGAMHSVELAFEDSVPVHSEIEAEFLLPYFDGPVAVSLGLGLDGSIGMDLRATGKDSSSLLKIERKNLLELSIRTFGIQRRTDLVEVHLSGTIRPLVADLDWPSFDVRSLTVDTAGHVTVDGGWLDLPEAKSLNFYGFKLELTKLGFGTEEATGEQWIGLNGGIHLAQGMPMGASVEGLRILWHPQKFAQDPVNNPPRVELNGVGVSLGVPGAFSFEGKVAFFSDNQRGTKGFRGDIKLDLPTLKFSIDGKLIIGQSRAGFTFFYIHLAVDLPAGIPIFNTGAGIYGLQGLLGVNMEPNRTAEEAWYQGWYKRNPIGATDTSKWWDTQGSMALGVGVSIGTVVDNGWSVNTKTLLIMVLPGPIILLEGKGDFLKMRPGTKDVTAEGAFAALLALDGRQRTFHMNLDARYNLLKVINVHGEAEAFFDFDDPSAWHLFVGQKEPEEKRIQAMILDLFGAKAYMMMWNDRLEVGGWYGVKGGPWHFGPLSAQLEAWRSGDGLISRNPKHFEAMFRQYGQLQLRAFGAGIDIEVDAGVAGRGPTPWEFDLWLRAALRINLLLGKVDLEAEIRLHWELQVEPVPALPLLAMAAEHFKTDAAWDIPFLGSTSATIPAAPVKALLPIPPDARPVVTFTRPVSDDVGIGQTTTRLPEPNADVIRPGHHEFRYHLRSVELLKQVGGAWRAVSTAAYIKSVGPGGTIELAHAPVDGQSFVGGELLSGGVRYTIQSVSGTTVSLSPGLSAPGSGPCLLSTKAPPLPGTIAAGGVANQKDGSSTVSLDRSNLVVNAYAGGVLRVGGKDFTVIGNTASTVHVLNYSPSGAAQEVEPAVGAYTLTAPEGTALYGQWLPIGGDDPSSKTKLQLGSKTPYTYFRRNDSSVIPPVAFDLCGPDVTEEPICLDIDNLTFDGQPVGIGPLTVGQSYNLDEVSFLPVFFPPNSQVSVVPWGGQNVVYLSGPRGEAPRLDFTFDPPLDMVEVWGQGELEVFANGRSIRLSPGVLGSARFDTSSSGGPIQHLSVETLPEGSGFITRLCFLPGWTCVAVPADAIPAVATDVGVGGLKFSGRNPTRLALENILAAVSALTTELPSIITMGEAQPFASDLNAVLNIVCPAVRQNAGGILSSLPARAEQLTGLVQWFSVIRDIRGRLIERPGQPLPAIIQQLVNQFLDDILTQEASLALQSTWTVRFPSPVTRARLALQGRIGTNLLVRAYSNDNEFDTHSQTAGAGSFRMTVDTIEQGWIDRLEVTGIDPIVDEVCYDRPEFAWSRKQQFENRQQWQRQLEYWYRKDEVLEPDVDYCLRLVTTVTDLGKDRSTQYWYGFFKAGLPAMGAKPDEAAYPDGGVLATLAAYVRRTVPEYGAGEEGKRPTYRGYDVGVEFNENYVDQLYLQARRPLRMRLLDNNGQPIANIANYWGEAPDLRLSEGEQAWVAAVELSQSKRCATVNWSEVPGDGTLLASGEDLDLQPGALHRAELVAQDANTARIVHSFEFTASRFVNFIHHLHSFEDRGWGLTAQSVAAADFADVWNAVRPKVIEVQQRRTTLKDKSDQLKNPTITLTRDQFKGHEEALQAAGTAWTELETEAAKWFNDLSKKLGLASRALPSVVEISILRSASGGLALLLESPEPLDWRRLKLTLGRSPYSPTGTNLQPATLASRVKISGAVLPLLPTRTQYSVELLGRELTMLDGYKVEVAEDAAKLTFSPYFTFPAGMVLGAGKRLTIHNAIRPALPEEGVAYLMQDENELRSGAISYLPEKVAWVRLVNSAGQVVHQRVIQEVENYQSPVGSEIALDLGITGTNGTRRAVVLPNGDGTRALVLLEDAGSVSIPAGAYLLTLEFQRDIGSEAPVLRSAGRSTPEIARLEFVI